jgi:HD-GYP domain-containing protein (c-di-GMP phosphodiesterase class II)
VSTVEAPAAAPIHADELGIELVAQARTRARLKLAGAEERLALALAGAFLAAAVGAAILLPRVRALSPTTAVVAILAYALVARIRFEVGHGAVLPTQLVLVPMLFALPPRSVPLLVAGGLLLSKTPDLVSRRFALNKLPFPLVDATHSLGPAVVLSLAGGLTASWHDTPIYIGALAAQFGMDFVPGAIWSRATWNGIAVREHARSMRVPFLFDTALAPVGLAVAIATVGRPWGVLLVLPLVALLKVFSRERQVRIDHALELSTAYRGTAMLLGDVIEADDEYTGTHSRDVVDLVLAVADRLGLDSRDRQQAEFAALLHDVGKVKIPSELINKPGPLDAVERALMNQHTIVGESMLLKIGGLLGDVGRVVRSCHERWDGDGYPDGLAGEEIPLVARIVCACDAWSAMTTDRAYRQAMPVHVAAAELRACAGTHFDPRVVEALVAVLGV